MGLTKISHGMSPRAAVVANHENFSAWLLTVNGQVPAGFDSSLITIPGIIHNLVPVTLGNIVGGAGFVGFVYWAIYRKGLSAHTSKP